jgi:hypothetical protein
MPIRKQMSRYLKLGLIIFTLSFPVLAQKKVAIVSMLRGEAFLIEAGKEKKLAQEMWVTSGSTVKTKEKSVIRLTFIDKSTMNVGPNSQMKIEQFGGNDSGVIDLVKGKIRSQVSKDYLQQDKSKSKVFVKTQNAVMGIRGTDFMISTNGQNTSAVLFEGSVVFNNFENPGSNIETSKLEQIVSSGERLNPGEFSVVTNDQQPTIPASLNVQQLEVLEKNQNFEDKKSSKSSEQKVSQSIVPPGLTGEKVGNDSEALKNELKQVTDSAPKIESDKKMDPDSARGYERGGQVKPAEGSFIHLESGVVIPPPADAVFDGTSGTFIAGTNAGKVDSVGNFTPPQGMTISDTGKVEISVQKPDGQIVKIEIVLKPIVIPSASIINPSINTGAAIPGTPVKEPGAIRPVINAMNLPGTSIPVGNDIINPNFAPNILQDFANFQQNNNGGLQNVNQAVQNSNTTPVNVIIDIE